MCREFAFLWVKLVRQLFTKSDVRLNAQKSEESRVVESYISSEDESRHRDVKSLVPTPAPLKR